MSQKSEIKPTNWKVTYSDGVAPRTEEQVFWPTVEEFFTNQDEAIDRFQDLKASYRATGQISSLTLCRVDTWKVALRAE